MLLETLPRELLEMIASKLDVSALLKLSSTNSTLYQTLTQSFVWRDLYLEIKKKYKIERDAHPLLISGHKVSLTHQAMFTKLYLFYERQNACGLCHSTNCPLIHISSWTLNACPCVLFHLVPKDNVRRDYGIFDADCLPTWDSIYLPPQSEFFKQIAFYFAPDCEKLAMKQLGFEEYSGHLEKRNVDVQVYRKQRHDWFQSELHDLGLSHYQLNETEWTFVRSSISSFLHQNDSKSFKEEWEIHSSLLYVKQELEKKQRKEKLLKTMDEMGLSVDVLTRCGEEYVETGILPRCFTTIICESEHCFLTSISPTLLHSLCYAGTCTVSQLGHHIAQHHANLKRIEMLIESIVHKRMHGKEYSLEFLVRWIKQVLQKQNPKSVTNSVLTSIVQLVCKKYVLSKQTQQVQDKDFYTKMLHFLESSIETKCPLISKKLLPLYKSFDDPVVRNTVDRFCAAKHRYCTKHLTVCLEYAVSDLASHYRQKQSELYLIKELSKFMPGFEKSGLKAPGSKERYDSAIRLGMWMHVPLNAFRIFREESLYTHLARSIPDFEYKEMLEKSKQTYRQFVLSDSPLSQSNLAEWPKNGEMVLVITQILKDEHHKNCKIQLGNRVLTSLGLDLEADAKLRFKFTQWLNEDESIESLTESCKSYIDHQERSRKLETVKVLVKASTKLQECFPVKSDLLLFCETVQFQLLLNSSPKFHGYLNGKDVPLYDIVQETVSCCEAAIRNQVSPEGILVLLHELGWN